MFRRNSLAPIGVRTRQSLFLDDNEEVRPQALPCSPDEFVISQRGRRSLPVTWSPDDNLRKQNHQNRSKQTSKPPTVKRSAAFMRMLLGPDDCHVKKKAKKPDPANIMTTRANHETISFSPEKLDFTDMNTPLKYKLPPREKVPGNKHVPKLNLDVGAPEKLVSGTRKRLLDTGNDGESSEMSSKKSKS